MFDDTIVASPFLPGVRLHDVTPSRLAEVAADGVVVAVSAASRVRIRAQETDLVAGPGSLLILPPDEGRRIELNGVQRVRALAVDPVWLTACGSFVPQAPAACDDPAARQAFLRLIAALGTAEPADRVAHQWWTLRQGLWGGSPENFLRGAVRRALGHLHGAYSAKLSLDGIAAVARSSKYHLVRTFRKQIGLPPHGYQVLLRVLRARDLLRNGARSVAAAQEVGFLDQSHLSRHFVRLCGMTPGVFGRSVATVRAGEVAERVTTSAEMTDAVPTASTAR